MKAALAVMALALSGTAGAVTTTLTFNGVTWTTTTVDADTITLRIENALDALGNWANITHLWTLSIDPEGEVTSATIAPGSATFSGNELNANGCEGGLSGKACFTFDPFYALDNDETFTIDFVGGDGFNIEGIFHIKVGFLCSPTGTSETDDTKACGSLMSRDTATSSGSTGSTGSTGEIVPEPGTMALLGLGLVGLGFLRRRKQAA